MYDDDSGLDDATLQIRAILPQLKNEFSPPFSRPLYRLVQRDGDRSPAGYSVLSEIASTIRRTSERLARWRSGQRELRYLRARRLQLEREEWEA